MPYEQVLAAQSIQAEASTKAARRLARKRSRLDGRDDLELLYEEQKRLIEEAAAKQAKEEAMMIGVVSEELAATVVPKSQLEKEFESDEL